MQGNESSSVVILKRRRMRRSGSAPLFRSMVILRPDLSVSSRMSLISFREPALAFSMIFSMMTSEVVVGGISVISMQFPALS